MTTDQQEHPEQPQSPLVSSSDRPTAKRLAVIAERAGIRLWGLCRLHYRSLDSARYSEAMARIVTAALAEVGHWAEREQAKAAEWRARYIRAEEQVCELKRQLRAATEERDRLTKQLGKAMAAVAKHKPDPPLARKMTGKIGNEEQHAELQGTVPSGTQSANREIPASAEEGIRA